MTRNLYLPHPRSWFRSCVPILVLVVLFAVTSCSVRAGGVDELTLAPFVAGIVTRSSDLVYISEQDSEVVAFYRTMPGKEVTDDVFLTILKRPPETRIIRESWSSFFQIRTANDPTGRWRILREYLENHLTNLVVFRVPRDAPYDHQYDLYAVGVFDGKTVVGVQMFGVAT